MCLLCFFINFLILCMKIKIIIYFFFNMKTNNSENNIKNNNIKNLNFPESLSSINLKSNSNLLNSLRTNEILPKISPKIKNIFENKSNSYLFNFITNVSNNIRIETEKTILDSNKFILNNKSKKNIKNYFTNNNINNHFNKNFENLKNKRKINLNSFKTNETKNLLSNCVSSPFLTDIKKTSKSKEKENNLIEKTLSSISVSKNIPKEKINYLNIIEFVHINHTLI